VSRDENACSTSSDLDFPLVSIVTPSLNMAPYLRGAIENVLAQEYPCLEHIVIDGGSIDNTIPMLQEYSHIRWLSEPDSGQANALNKGFRMASGEIIGWLNADDTFTPQAVARAVAYLTRHPSCDVIYGDCNILDAQGSLIRVYRPPKLEGALALVESFIHTPAVFWRKPVFEKVGYLDERYHYCMDNEFWIRMAPIVRREYLEGPLANYHLRMGNKGTTAKAEFGVEMCQIYEELASREPFHSEVPSVVWRSIRGGHYWSTGLALCREGQIMRAERYLRQAIDDFQILDDVNLAILALVRDYETQIPYSKSDVYALVAVLPLSAIEKKRILAIVRAGYHRTRFYIEHQAGNWQQVRSQGLNAIRQDPGLLTQRGFLSILGEAMMGHKIMNWVRERL